MDQMPDDNSQALTRLKIWPLLGGALVLVLAAFFAYQQYFSRPEATHLNEKELTDAFVMAARNVQTRFKLGDEEQFLTTHPHACEEWLGNMTNVSSFYTRCNPSYLECYYQGKLGKVADDLTAAPILKTHHFQFVPYRNGKIYRLISKAEASGSFLPSFGMEFELVSKEHPEYRMRFILEDSCHDLFLPRRKYAYGEESKIEPLEWDNLDSNIFIDRFQVTNRDVLDWIEATENKEIKIDLTKLPFPATELTLEQMKKYCEFRGKELLTAQVYDAATFLPTDLEDIEPVKVKRGPYYWTKDAKSTFLYKKDLKLVNQENCRYAYVQNCKSIISYDPFYLSPSWMGLNQILGGPMEVVHNPLEPKLNLKVSSYYLNVSSPWHVLGKRGTWNGIGHTPQDISFDKENPLQDKVEKVDIAFRCMKKSPFILKETDE